jgi:hypothetical protein
MIGPVAISGSTRGISRTKSAAQAVMAAADAIQRKVI